MMTVIRDLGQWTLETQGQGQAGMSKESRILGNKNIVTSVPVSVNDPAT